MQPVVKKEAPTRSVSVMVKEDAPHPEWMQSFAQHPLPRFSELMAQSDSANVAPVSLARTATQRGDTIEGVLRTSLGSTKDVESWARDPRIVQMKRMLARDSQLLKVEKEASSGPQFYLDSPAKGLNVEQTKASLATPEGQKIAEQNAVIPGRVALPDPKEASPAMLMAFTGVLLHQKARDIELPSFARRGLERLEEGFGRIRSVYAQGATSHRAALAQTADIAERAFLVVDAAKSPQQKEVEARENKVDTFFALANTAARASSRESYKETFSRGLVSDVVASAALSKDAASVSDLDGFSQAAARLNRVGLIDDRDARLQVENARPLEEVQPQPVADRPQAERQAIKDAFAPPPVAPSELKEKAREDAKTVVGAQKEKEIEFKSEPVKEATALTTAQQVGWSGAYMVEEFARDRAEDRTKNALEDKFTKSYEKQAAASEKKADDSMARMSRGALLESAGVQAQGAGSSAAQVKPVLELAAGNVQAGVRMAVQADRPAMTRPPLVKAAARKAQDLQR